VVRLRCHTPTVPRGILLAGGQLFPWPYQGQLGRPADESLGDLKHPLVGEGEGQSRAVGVRLWLSGWFAGDFELPGDIKPSESSLVAHRKINIKRKKSKGTEETPHGEKRVLCSRGGKRKKRTYTQAHSHRYNEIYPTPTPLGAHVCAHSGTYAHMYEWHYPDIHHPPPHTHTNVCTHTHTHTHPSPQHQASATETSKSTNK